MEYKILGEVGRGKTKAIHKTDQSNVVVLENLKNITANDDPNVTRQFEIKAVTATTTTCKIFELLEETGIPVAYIEQVSPTSFVAEYCDMLPLEAIARRYAVGSHLKRNPHISATTPPFRFSCLKTELFLKTTKGHCTLSDGKDRDLGLDPIKGEEDPLLIQGKASWELYHAKMPAWVKGARLREIDFNDLVFPSQPIEELTRQVFLVLEGAWSQLGWRLIDLKIEFGITKKGELVVADVIDNDSWRLRSPDWQEMSKQVFRDQIATDAVDLNDLSWRYQLVADLVGQFRIPTQVIILWKGSEHDTLDLSKSIAEPVGVALLETAISGHRDTHSVLQALSITEAEYPDGGVIIACVGHSNGLGPILSAHTHWPVINCPLTPEDLMSSVRLPCRVPVTTVLKIENAVHHALQILAPKNPAVYAVVRKLAEADGGLPAGIAFSNITAKRRRKVR